MDAHWTLLALAFTAAAGWAVGRRPAEIPSAPPLGGWSGFRGAALLTRASRLLLDRIALVWGLLALHALLRAAGRLDAARLVGVPSLLARALWLAALVRASRQDSAGAR